MVWDISVPPDTDPFRQGASVIRTFKSDLQSALQAEGVFPGASVATPVFRWKPRRGSQALRPANDAVNPGTVYYNTDLSQWELDTGSAWMALSHAFPAAVFVPYLGTTAPPGWLLCDGSAVSRTTYAALYAVIGNACGSGDGSTTFNVPDLRGRFLRGLDGAANRDPDHGARTAMASGGNTGNQIGSVQAQGTAKNGLTLTDAGHTHAEVVSNALTGALGVQSVTGIDATTTTTLQDALSTTGIILTGDIETRPINAYCNFIVKT